MPSRNRDTLKYFFSDGAMPSSDMFADLIDSMLNMSDEGFSKSDQNGFEITNLNDSDRLISFYKQSHPEQPLWSVGFDGSESSLIISRCSAVQNFESERKDTTNYQQGYKVKAEEERGDTDERLRYGLKLDSSEEDIKIGIGLEKPKDSLHVFGNVRANGRRGESDFGYPTPAADGNWHTIAGPFVGCLTLEVVARAKNDAKKRYAMMHAIATHTISPGKKGLLSFLGLKNRIRYTNSFFDSFLHKLKLRWIPGKERGQYILQLRTNCDYGKDGVISFHIINLWSEFDSSLQDSIKSRTDNPGFNNNQESV